MYEETPKNAVIFATTGTDGCHYCMVESENGINIYLVFPNMGKESVRLVGHSMNELLSYALSINGLFDCVFNLEKNLFLEEVKNLKDELKTKLNSNRFINDLNALKLIYQIKNVPASEVYDTLREMNRI